MMKNRDFMVKLINRAKNAGCSALVLTADLQVMGQRHKDIKNGLSTPPKITITNILDMMTKPTWCWNMLKTKRRTFGNIVGHIDGITDTSSLSSWTAEQFDPCLSWKDVEWVKQQWGGKLIIKGIMEIADALKAVEAGADAIVVSNHGGRQLDDAPSTISVLEEIVQAVKPYNVEVYLDNVEVYLDSGVRSGQDILKAVALGAKGVLIGRPFIYGLGAYGEEGVQHILEILHKELDISMAFCGKTNINQVTQSILRGYSE